MDSAVDLVAVLAVAAEGVVGGCAENPETDGGGDVVHNSVMPKAATGRE
jgi:hypothetical protein